MDAILVVDAGSSSLKSQIFGVAQGALERRLRRQIDGIGVRPWVRAGRREPGWPPPCSRVALLVVPRDEEPLIARHASP